MLLLLVVVVSSDLRIKYFITNYKEHIILKKVFVLLFNCIFNLFKIKLLIISLYYKLIYHIDYIIDPYFL